MRISLFAQGTRGDVWPLVALGSHLVDAGHAVTMATGEEFRALVEAAGMRFAPLAVSLTDYIASDDGQHMLHTGGVPLIRAVQRLYQPHHATIDAQFRAAAEGAEALVCMHLTMDRAVCMADHLGVPVANVLFFPLSFTAEHPSVLLTTSHARLLRLGSVTHRLTHRVYWHGGAKNIRAFRRTLGLPDAPTPSFYRLERTRALTLYAYSAHVQPRPADWGEHLAVTGFWQLPAGVRERIGEQLPGDLAGWLEDDTPTVFLGLGSMPVLEPERLYADAVEVTAELGVRAVINADWRATGRIAGAEPEHIRFAEAVDHDRLLARCAAAVHHGGAGTLGASLRAGLPTMVCSVWADQPFWGSRVERLGVGTHVPFRKLDRARLREGLETLLDAPVRARAAALGDAIRSEGDGAPAAALRLQRWLADQRPHAPAARTAATADAG